MGRDPDGRIVGAEAEHRGPAQLLEQDQLPSVDNPGTHGLPKPGGVNKPGRIDNKSGHCQSNARFCIHGLYLHYFIT
jgi:hypothetical protein